MKTARARSGCGLLTLLRDRRGAVSPLLALWLIPLIGILAFATETSSWFYMQRAAQNAADSAAMAAAINNCTTALPCYTTGHSTTYDNEAKAVAARNGFDDAAADVVVTSSNAATCPATGVANCYRVTITKTVPVTLLRAVGFVGTSRNVTATAFASPAGGARTYCVLAMGTSGVTISNNSPNIPPAFCHMMTNSTANPATSCNGNKQVADIIDAVGDPGPTCAPNHNAGVPAAVTTTYSSKAASIPSAATACPGGFATGRTISGAVVLGTNEPPVCGPLTVSADATISTPSGGTVLYIYNGNLNLHPQPQPNTNLTTLAGSGLALVFTGNQAGANHIVDFGGTSVLDIAAPTTGTWAGMAIYQDASANGPTTGIDFGISPATGGNPAWKVTGLIYAPKANVTLSGGVIKSTAGQACFSLVSKTFTASGNYSIYSDSQSNCAGAGLSPPSAGQGGTRPSLTK
jgi:Flp pilus assembly protein TadG